MTPYEKYKRKMDPIRRKHEWELVNGKPPKVKKNKRREHYPKAELGDRILSHPAARTLGSAPGPGWWLLRFDGGVSGNGAAWASGRWAFRLTDGGRLVHSGNGPATGNPVTSNTCEWQALASGLEYVGGQPLGTVPGLLIEGDSDLVCCQLGGRWGVSNDALRSWRDRCLDVLAGLYLPWHVRWIPREMNADCDAMTWR